MNDSTGTTTATVTTRTADDLSERELREQARDAARTLWLRLMTLYNRAYAADSPVVNVQRMETRLLYHMYRDAQDIYEQMHDWLIYHPAADDTPRFTHDCSQCVFLGGYDAPIGDDETGAILPGETERTERFDLYFCPLDGDLPPRMIARYGNAGAAYICGMPRTRRESAPWPLAEALRRATQRHLLPDATHPQGFIPQQSQTADEGSLP